MNLFGSVTNNGTVNIEIGRTAYFFGNVDGSGTYTGAGTAEFLANFSPGSSPASVSSAGNLKLDASAKLVIELGGTEPGTQFDQVHVGGQLALGGALMVSLINDFHPAARISFDILDWGSLAGAFSSIQLPTLADGLIWDTSQLYSAGVILVDLPGIPGDFNLDHVVDAADFVTWRKGLGTIYTTADYDVWRAHFGQTAGGGLGANFSGAEMPEPSGWTILLATSVALPFVRRRS